MYKSLVYVASPLYYAALRGLPLRALILMLNWRNFTALSAASEEGHEAVVRLMLSKGANMSSGPTANALYGASKGGFKDVVQLLLDSGAEKHGDEVDQASKGGHAHVVQLLLDRSADFNGRELKAGSKKRSRAGGSTAAAQRGRDRDEIGTRWGRARQRRWHQDEVMTRWRNGC